MYLPPTYTYMNYGAPYTFVPGQTMYGAPMRTGVQQFGQNPYYPYGQPINGKPGKPGKAPKPGKVAAPKQSLGCNTNYCTSPLGLLRLLLIPSLIATIIAAALVRNRDWKVRTESAWNNSVWISTLTFACVGLATVLLTFLFNICNCVNAICRLCPCTIFIALFDLAWFVALTVLGAFCARREAVNKSDFKNVSLNKGAFGVTAAFALLSALLFLLSGLYGLFKRKAPKMMAKGVAAQAMGGGYPGYPGYPRGF